MKELVSKLTMYRNLGKGSPLSKLAKAFRNIDNSECSKNEILNQVNTEAYKIVELANACKFESDIWANYIVYIIASNENPFSLKAERRKFVDDTLKSFAINDFEVFIKLINYDFSIIEEKLGTNCFSLLRNYKSIDNDKSLDNHSLSQRINELYHLLKGVNNVNEFYDIVTNFYFKYGVGDFGLNKAFRISAFKDEYLITPIVGTSNITFSDLIGYEEQKNKLIKNTEAFVNGKPANNALLYGDVGTGKSSSIKSILNMFYDKGLRMIEVYKYDYEYLPEIISILKNRNYRFIIYLDDLSFEKNETEYKYLKAVIEGGLEVKPENVLIYATSNRVHLFHETFSDRQEVEKDDVHISDTLAEHTSLASRFGLTLAYYNVRRAEFFDMVCEIAKRYKELSNVSKDELIKKATLWNQHHNDLSGRSAQQFINDLLIN